MTPSVSVFCSLNVTFCRFNVRRLCCLLRTSGGEIFTTSHLSQLFILEVIKCVHDPRNLVTIKLKIQHNFSEKKMKEIFYISFKLK